MTDGKMRAFIAIELPQEIKEFLGTLQDRLVTGLRLTLAKTLEGANRYLDEEFLPEWD